MEIWEPLVTATIIKNTKPFDFFRESLYKNCENGVNVRLSRVTEGTKQTYYIS